MVNHHPCWFPGPHELRHTGVHESEGPGSGLDPGPSTITPGAFRLMEQGKAYQAPGLRDDSNADTTIPELQWRPSSSYRRRSVLIFSTMSRNTQNSDHIPGHPSDERIRNAQPRTSLAIHKGRIWIHTFYDESGQCPDGRRPVLSHQHQKESDRLGWEAVFEEEAGAPAVLEYNGTLQDSGNADAGVQAAHNDSCPVLGR